MDIENYGITKFESFGYKSSEDKASYQNKSLFISVTHSSHANRLLMLKPINMLSVKVFIRNVILKTFHPRFQKFE